MASNGNITGVAANSWAGEAFYSNHQQTGHSAEFGNGGNRLYGVIGFNTTTRGPNGNFNTRLTSQQGLQSYDPAALNIREPFRMGRFIFKIIKIPPFFDPNIALYMRFILEDNVKQVSGIPSNSIDTISQTNGATRIESDFPGNYKQNGKELSVQTIEYAGGVVRKFVDYWMGGISDRETTIGHMYGAKLPYVRSSYSGSFLYSILGPTARPTDIEFNCMFHECWPTKEVADYLSSNTLGDVGGVSDVEISLTGMYQNAPEVDILGQLVAAGYGLYSESALNQTMPAYIYQTYFGKACGTEEARLALTIQQNDRLAKMATDTANKHPYTKDIQSIRVEKVLKAAWNGDAEAANTIASAYTYTDAYNSIGLGGNS